MADQKDLYQKERHVKRPIYRTLLISTAIILAVLCVALAAVSYTTSRSSLYSNLNSRLTEIVSYVEENADADDLELCIEHGRSSAKRDALQEFMNGVVDGFEIEYLYIVIPGQRVMINVVSATSAEEKAAGETDMLLLEETDAYTQEELDRYRSFWNATEIQYFEETSDYGEYYTAVKPLCNSAGETVALICADIPSGELHERLYERFLLSIALAIVLIGLFGLAVVLWIRRNITKPLLELEISAREFADIDKDEEKSLDKLHFRTPEVKVENEIKSLAGAIEKMSEDMRKYAMDVISAENRAATAEEEKERLAEEARAAAKIAELTSSMSNLFNNMPVLSFSKDTNTGKYIACNNLFADFANRKSPEEVVGLSDHDIFDKETADHFIEDDYLAMSMDEPYVFIEDALDAAGRPRQFQTTKMKFVDSEGRLCLLGMSVDVTEMMRIKSETEKTKEAYEKAKSASVTYQSLARALALDYSYLYYVDPDTNNFTEYGTGVGDDNLTVRRTGEDFFTQSRHDAQQILHRDDIPKFLEVFTKENILATIKKSGSFNLSYRMITTGEPVYYNMKISHMSDDDKHIIVGVNNVDAQMRQEEAAERIKEERITYARMSALSGDFICIYTVDPVTGEYTEYTATAEYAGLGIAKEGHDFFSQTAKDIDTYVYTDDRERLKASFTKENVMRQIEKSGMFIIEYRLNLNGNPTFVNIKAALTYENDMPQLVIGIVNVDALVKREQEYEYNLSVEKTKANVDALTGVKNKHAYVEVEADLNHKIGEGETVEFAVTVFDVNGLKQVNDTQGHQAGDELIRNACKIICDVYKHSPVFRIGGDEFAVIAQGQDYVNAEALVEEIGKVNTQNLKTPGGVVVACGMAKYSGERSVSAVFEHADRRMYENKNYLKTL